jgi:predicted DNA-binding protein
MYEVYHMRKFKLPVPATTTNKSIRFPDSVIERVETAITGTDCTFTAFVVEAVKVALDNFEDEN